MAITTPSFSQKNSDYKLEIPSRSPSPKEKVEITLFPYIQSIKLLSNPQWRSNDEGYSYSEILNFFTSNFLEKEFINTEYLFSALPNEWKKDFLSATKCEILWKIKNSSELLSFLKEVPNTASNIKILDLICMALHVKRRKEEAIEIEKIILQYNQIPKVEHIRNEIWNRDFLTKLRKNHSENNLKKLAVSLSKSSSYSPSISRPNTPQIPGSRGNASLPPRSPHSSTTLEKRLSPPPLFSSR